MKRSAVFAFARLASTLFATAVVAGDAPPEPRDEPVEMTVSSPPLVTNDTGTPGPGNWEINFTADGDLARDAEQFEAPLLDLNYGIGERIQLTFEVPYGISRTTAADTAGARTMTTQRGVGNAGASVKVRVLENRESGWSLALFPKLEFRLPGSKLEAAGGVASRETNASLPALLTWEFPRVSFSANAGVEKSSAAPRADYFAGFGAGFRLSDRLALLGELAGQGLGRARERRLLTNGGLRLKFSASRSLLVSAGRDLRAGSDVRRHDYFSVTFQQLLERPR